MDIVGIGGIVLSVIDKLFPNQSEIKKADLELKKTMIEAEVNLKLAEFNQRIEQIKVNQAEAANPNRKIATWREMIGYAGACALWYFWIIQPIIIAVSIIVQHPLDKNLFPEFDVLQVLYVICGMLGLDAAPLIANSAVNRFKKK